MPTRLTHGGLGEATVRERGAQTARATTPFDYLFKDLVNQPEAHLPQGEQAGAIVQQLLDLAQTMVDDSNQEENNSKIPAIYTYWGQFIDHDITATTSNSDPEQLVLGILQEPQSFQPLDPTYVRANLQNGRQPLLDLDSIYDGGPAADRIGIYQRDRIRFALGHNHNLGNELTPEPELGLARDLPRISESTMSEEWPLRTAITGDKRNDDNLIVAQFTTAMLKFHNAIVDWVEAQEGLQGEALFQRAQQLTRWHFQWLVVNDYLKTIAMENVVAKVLATHQSSLLTTLFMPLEFSAAAFRFGHSMVRGEYNYNKNFGSPRAGATLQHLLALTGSGGLSSTLEAHPTLPNSWIIEWNRFVDKKSPNAGDFARKIDTNLAPPMSRLVNEWRRALDQDFDEYSRKIFRHLAKRNLLRGYLFHLPVGQAIAEALGVRPLARHDLQKRRRKHPHTPLDGILGQKTPLWYYILKEAEEQSDGNTLGEVGSHLVAHTLVGLLRLDPDSYLAKGWEPAQGVHLPGNVPIRSIGDLLRFAGVAQ
ncbi:MAG: heme peroxidase family protein [Caldilineaceae bacterium]